MGDFLGNLVTKSLNPAEEVMPRPVATFEPPPKEGGLFSAPPPSLGTGGEPPLPPLVTHMETPLPAAVSPQTLSISRPQPPDDRPATPGRPRDLLPPSKPAAPQPARIVPEAPPGQPEPVQPKAARLSPDRALLPAEADPVQPVALPAPGPAPPRSLVAHEPPARRAAARQAANPGAASPAPAPAPRAVAGQTAEPAKAASPTPTPTPPASPQEPEPRVRPIRARRAPATVLQDQPQRPPVASGGEQDAVWSQRTADRQRGPAPEAAIPRFELAPVPATLAAVVVRPQVEPAGRVEPTASARAEPVATPEPAPTIQVTIGRVEVRAMPPPVPAPKKQRSKPLVMSLDEYLRQRANGGGR